MWILLVSPFQLLNEVHSTGQLPGISSRWDLDIGPTAGHPPITRDTQGHPCTHGDGCATAPTCTKHSGDEWLPSNRTHYMQEERSMKRALMKKAKYAFIFSPNGHSIIPQMTDSNKNLISENGSVPLWQYNTLGKKTELQISGKVCLHLPWFCTGWKLSDQGVEHHIHANKSSQGRILLMFTQLPAGSEHRQRLSFPKSKRYWLCTLWITLIFIHRTWVLKKEPKKSKCFFPPPDATPKNICTENVLQFNHAK